MAFHDHSNQLHALETTPVPYIAFRSASPMQLTVQVWGDGSVAPLQVETTVGGPAIVVSQL